MKIREGFVSNSSSSSFMIINKTTGKDIHTLIQESEKTYQEAHGKEYLEYKEEADGINETFRKLANEGKCMIMYSSVEQGGEEGVESVVNKLNKVLNLDIELEWEEY